MLRAALRLIEPRITSAGGPSGGSLCVLDEDRLEDVRGSLAGVDRLLDALEDVLPAVHAPTVDFRCEEPKQRPPGHPDTILLETGLLVRGPIVKGRAEQLGRGENVRARLVEQVEDFLAVAAVDREPGHQPASPDAATSSSRSWSSSTSWASNR